jgi:hypothetical protein
MFRNTGSSQEPRSSFYNNVVCKSLQCVQLLTSLSRILVNNHRGRESCVSMGKRSRSHTSAKEIGCFLAALLESGICDCINNYDTAQTWCAI